MRSVYKCLQTPHKRGAVMQFEDSMCDSPTVFFQDGLWFMLFVRISKNTAESGYDTHLACSKDLLHWEYLYPVLRRSGAGGWDSAQVGAYLAFQDITFGGSNELQRINGWNYLVYLAGSQNGYETDPLMTGLCRAEDILRPATIERLPRPIFRPEDSDSRRGEMLSIYKHCMFADSALSTGHPYVSAYNAKDETHHESIFLAVSDDAEHWERYGDRAVVDDREARINGDPQIVKIGELYVMVHFLLKGEHTYNTFACSYNLVDWKTWDGEPLIRSEFEWENVFAHKSWVIRYQGCVYHFYCAVNSKGERFIALATS